MVEMVEANCSSKYRENRIVRRNFDDSPEDIYRKTKLFTNKNVQKWYRGWIGDAECSKPEYNIDDFYKTEHPQPDGAMFRAQRIPLAASNACGVCPVAAECVTWSLWQESVLSLVDLALIDSQPDGKAELVGYGYKHSFPQERRDLISVFQNGRISLLDYGRYVPQFIEFRRGLDMNICYALDRDFVISLKSNRLVFEPVQLELDV